MMASRHLGRKIVVFLAVVYVAIAVFSGMILAEIALHPPRRPIGSAAGMRAAAQRESGSVISNVGIVAADDARLAGWYARPTQYNGSAVVLLHGVSDNREGMSGFARTFLLHGYEVLLPDSRAHGESGGTFATYGIKEQDDVHRWIDWLYKSDAPPRCVYLLGESMGAAIAIQATAGEPRICATVAESPFATFRNVAFQRVGSIVHAGPWFGRTLARPAVEFAFLIVRIRTGVALSAASPKDSIEHTRTPILLIHGLADTNIAPSNSELLHRIAPDHSELWEVPGADHCGASRVQPEEFNRRVLAWFSDHSQRAADARP